MYTSVVCGIESNHYIYNETQIETLHNQDLYKLTNFNSQLHYTLLPSEPTGLKLEIISINGVNPLDILGVLYDCETSLQSYSAYIPLINCVTRHFLNATLSQPFIDYYKQSGNFTSIQGEQYRYTYLQSTEPYATIKSDKSTWEVSIYWEDLQPVVKILCGNTTCISSPIEYQDEETFIKHVALCKLYASLGLRKR